MIYLLTGDNTFEIEQKLTELTDGFDGEVERVDGTSIDTNRLADLVAGGTLFSTKRMVVIRYLSENKSLWSALGDWLNRLSDDVTLVLVDPSADKRTKTYKDLAKKSSVHEYKLWRDYDTAKAEKWVLDRSNLDPRSARSLVARIGVDQWALHNALEKLSVLDEITPEVIEQAIEASPHESAFQLLDAALAGEASRVSAMVRDLELHEDPYRVLGLLSSQVFAMCLLSSTDAAPAVIASEAKISSYTLQNLASKARRMETSKIKRSVDWLAKADEATKSGDEPWLAIETALLHIARG